MTAADSTPDDARDATSLPARPGTVEDALRLVVVLSAGPGLAPLIDQLLPDQFYAHIARLKGLKTVDDVTARMEELVTLFDDLIVSRLPPAVVADKRRSSPGDGKIRPKSSPGTGRPRRDPD